MSRKIETTVFTYSELSEDAKAKARDWYREMDAQSGDTFFSESVLDDFGEVLTACGFDLVRGARGRDAIYWSGFGSQGDGASFAAYWRASRVDIDATLADRPATCPSNAELHPILIAARDLAALDGQAHGDTAPTTRGHSQVSDYGTGEDLEDNANAPDAADMFKELCSDLAHWLYHQLEREYAYQNTDAAVAESIEANEYEFTADGAPA